MSRAAGGHHSEDQELSLPSQVEARQPSVCHSVTSTVQEASVIPQQAQNMSQLTTRNSVALGTLHCLHGHQVNSVDVAEPRHTIQNEADKDRVNGNTQLKMFQPVEILENQLLF